MMAAGIGWTLILGVLLVIGHGPFAGYGIAHHRWQFIVSIGVTVVAGVGLTVARLVQRR